MIKNINMPKEQLVSALEKLYRENDILLNTINLQNQQLEKLNELKGDYVLAEQCNDNLQDAMFVILYTLNQFDEKEIDPSKLSKVLSTIGSVAINSIVDVPIKDLYENEVINGSIIAQKLASHFYNEIENQHIGQVTIKFSDCNL